MLVLTHLRPMFLFYFPFYFLFFLFSWVFCGSKFFFSWVFCCSKFFSRGYFVGAKFLLMGTRFFLGGLSWVQIFSGRYFVGHQVVGQMQVLVKKMLDAIFITSITAVHIHLTGFLILKSLFIMFNMNSFYRTDVLKLHY